MAKRSEMSKGTRSDFEGESADVCFIGWLGPEHQPDDAPDTRLGKALLNGLFGKIKGIEERRIVRSIEPCPLCSSTVYVGEDGTIVSCSSDDETRAARDRLVKQDCDWKPLGHSDIWVVCEGEGYFAAPSLIIHFIQDHGYAPPAVFSERVKALQEEHGALQKFDVRTQP